MLPSCAADAIAARRKRADRAASVDRRRLTPQSRDDESILVMNLSASANELSGLRFVEIGSTPFLKSAFPDQTDFFSTFIAQDHDDPGTEVVRCLSAR